MEIFHHNLKDNKDISIRYSKSKNHAEAKKILFVLHGRSEWLEKYKTLIETLDLPGDTAWATWDHRGQGGSGGKPGHIDSYDTFAKDTREMVELLSEGRPYAFVCHSMGSLIATYSTLADYVSPTSMILMSPLFGLPKVPVLTLFDRALAKYTTKFGLGGINLAFDKHGSIPFEGNRLTHSPENYKFILNYPFKWAGPTFGWIHSTIMASDYIFNPSNLSRLKAKTAVICGSDERVVDATAFQKWVDLASDGREIPFKRVSGARHELHMETSEYFKEAVEYIHNHIGW